MKYVIFIFLGLGLIGCGKVNLPKVTTDSDIKQEEPKEEKTKKEKKDKEEKESKKEEEAVAVAESEEEQYDAGFEGCTMLATGMVSRTYTNTHTGEDYTVRISGRVFCKKGDPDLFVLFANEIETSCNIGVTSPTCTVSVLEITEDIEVRAQTNNQIAVTLEALIAVPSSFY